MSDNVTLISFISYEISIPMSPESISSDRQLLQAILLRFPASEYAETLMPINSGYSLVDTRLPKFSLAILKQYEFMFTRSALVVQSNYT